jgi:hypothetical protein
LMIWPSLNRLVFITPKIKNYPFHCFRITGGIHLKGEKRKLSVAALGGNTYGIRRRMRKD